MSVCRDALQLGSPLDRAITEKGVLQLLFDLRFLRNSLAGGRPAASAAGGGVPSRGQLHGSSAPGSAALSQRKRAFSDVESSLQVGLPAHQMAPVNHTGQDMHHVKAEDALDVPISEAPSRISCPQSAHTLKLN